MQELIASILVWIATSTGYDTAELNAPHVEYRSYTDLAVMYYQPATLGELAGKQVVAGIHRRGVVFLTHDFDPADVEDRSTLVQEVFHYVQYQHGQMDVRCKGSIEREAHEVEDRWRQANDLEPLYSSTYLGLLEMRFCPPQRHRNRFHYKRR